MTTRDLVVTTLAQTEIETNTIFEFGIRFDWGKVGYCRFVKYGKFGHHREEKKKDLILNVIRHTGSSLGCCDFEAFIKADSINDFHDKALIIVQSALHQYELKTFQEQKKFDDALTSIEHMKI